jgi:Xaa-Pro aminopeptidase
MRHRGVRGGVLVAGLLVLAAAPGRGQISDAEYAARRDTLAARIGSNAVVLCFGERDPIGFPAFYQVPAFRYLTGIDEPNAVLVLVTGSHGVDGMLFREARSVRDIMTDGPLEAPVAVERRTGLRVRPLSELRAAVDSLLGGGRALYTLRDVRPYGGSPDSLTRGTAFVADLRRRSPEVHPRPADAALDLMRARKSPAEQALLRASAERASDAMTDAMRSVRPGLREYELQALVEYGFRSRGADRPSFATNVSAGANATTVHHRAADEQLESGQLVLVDAGAAYRGYASDVTRTVPVNGRFTTDQRAIYQLVRDAQAAAERQVRLGAPVSAMDDSARAVIARGLATLGVIESPDAVFDPPWAAQCTRAPVLCRQSFLFYSHGLGHDLGLEVHDPVPLRRSDRRFAAGDAFTIEPGVYVSMRRLALLPDTPRNRAFISRVRAAVERYDGIGVRIEDDYLVTDRGVERISRTPREIAEIEALIADSADSRLGRRTAAPRR